MARANSSVIFGVMKIKIQKKITSKNGLLLVPVLKETLKRFPGFYPAKVKDFAKDRMKAGELTGAAGEILSTYTFSKDLPEKMMFMALGEEEKYSPNEARNYGGKLGRYLRKSKSTEVTLIIDPKTQNFLQELLEGIFLVQYEADTHKTQLEEVASRYELKKLNIVVEKTSKLFQAQVQRAVDIASAINFTKELVNSPSNVVDAAYIAQTAKDIAKDNRYKITVFGEKKLKQMKAGGILAVNQGCHKEPQLIVMEYYGAKSKKERPVVLIGKGVAFDTGGYNLKGRGGIEEMHQDMGGAASVLGVFTLLKKLGIEKNIIAVIPAVENLINERAYKPADIITMLSGNTVEITNTDAEGRLILADAITYAQKFKPEYMITVATLTGASAVATGNRYASLMGNAPGILQSLEAASQEVDDLFWPLPMHPDYQKSMKSSVADYRNYDMSSFGGSSKAAHFLDFFVGDTPWGHIDIGGTAFTKEPKPYQGKGATGHSVRALIHFLES